MTSLKNNMKHRKLFSFPPMKRGKQNLPIVPELPIQRVVTGDTEVDAVLWLREMISTGDAGLVEKALEAASRIKTPLKVIESRYGDYLRKTYPDNTLGVALELCNFANLKEHAKSSTEKALRQHEARSRFGDTLFQNTPAEDFCVGALRGLKQVSLGSFDDEEVSIVFRARPELMPHTLSDCIHELRYWDELHWLRNAVSGAADTGTHEGRAREGFIFDLLAEIRPRSRKEAMATFVYLKKADVGSWLDTDKIVRNLIA